MQMKVVVGWGGGRDTQARPRGGGAHTPTVDNAVWIIKTRVFNQNSVALCVCPPDNLTTTTTVSRVCPSVCVCVCAQQDTLDTTEYSRSLSASHSLV